MKRLRTIFRSKAARVDLSGFLLILAAVVIVNVISSFWFFRLDLTAERRYTLAPVTRSFLRNLQHDVHVRVFLEGELNVGFQRLAKATGEMMDEFRLISDGAFSHEFINPTGNNEALALLDEFGMTPVPVYEAAADGRQVRSNVFPFAIVTANGHEVAINLLENIPGLSGHENLNISKEALEYKLTFAIRQLVTDHIPAIAFLEGQGQLSEIDVWDITNTLSGYFRVDRGSIMDDPYVLDNYEVLIIAKPHHAFSQKDKFVIDQYIMRGGKVLWLLDAVHVTLDSLRRATQTVGLATDLNLADQLFRYGVRINFDLLQDVQAAMIPVNVSRPGEQPNLVPVPWTFSPLLNPSDDHPVTRNINVVRGDFASSIDTVGNPQGVQRDVLLSTSRFTRRNPVPVFVTLALVNQELRREDFGSSFLPVAVSMEGSFPSAFTNRPIPPGVNIGHQDVIHVSQPTRMIVVADGDIIRNDVRLRHGASPRPLPLGFDEVSNHTFGNKQFILNAVKYLADEEGWLTLRNRDYQLRLLDREKLSSALVYWKWVNVLAPLFFLLLVGLTIPLIRKYRYSKTERQAGK